MKHTTTPIQFKVSDKSGDVSGILVLPKVAAHFLLFSHGAGAGMNHYTSPLYTFTELSHTFCG